MLSLLTPDLDVLKPLFERMRVHGSDLLEKNSGIAEEVRRTFADLDRIEDQLKKATKAISSASGLVTKYRGRSVPGPLSCCVNYCAIETLAYISLRRLGPHSSCSSTIAF